jgi:hypothetical protein
MDEGTVRELARAADLPLDDARLGLIAPQLGEWLRAANELSRKLQDDDLRATMPIAVFAHPASEGRAE